MNQFDPRYMQLLVSKLERINLNKQSVVSVGWTAFELRWLIVEKI
jgi:hypothetical protein